MPRRSALRLTILSIALAFLLLPPAMADSCDDCFGAASSDCCPASCCPCCTAGPPALTSSVRVNLGPVSRGLADDLPVSPCLAVPPRDVFHVPKPPLA